MTGKCRSGFIYMLKDRYNNKFIFFLKNNRDYNIIAIRNRLQFIIFTNNFRE